MNIKFTIEYKFKSTFLSWKIAKVVTGSVALINAPNNKQSEKPSPIEGNLTIQNKSALF